MSAKPSAKPKPDETEFTLAQRIIFKALVASDAGKTEVAIALFQIIAEHFDWGILYETKLEADGRRMAEARPERNKS